MRLSKAKKALIFWWRARERVVCLTALQQLEVTGAGAWMLQKEITRCKQFKVVPKIIIVVDCTKTLEPKKLYRGLFCNKIDLVTIA